MKKSTVLLLLSVAVVVTVAAWLLRPSPSTTASQKSTISQPVAAFSVTEAAEVSLRDQNHSVTLALDSGSWVVRERARFSADTGKLAGLLKRIATLKSVQTIDAPETYFDRLGLVAPAEPDAQQDNNEAAPSPDDEKTGTYLRVSDTSGKTIAEWIIGKVYYPQANTRMDASLQFGRYYRTVGDQTLVILAEDVAQGVTANPADWLDKSLLLPDVDPIRIESHPAAGADASWTAAVQGEEQNTSLTLLDIKKGETVKPGTLDSVVAQLKRLRFDDILVPSAENSQASTFKPVATAKITSKDGSVFDLSFGATDNGFIPLQIVRTPGATADGSPDAGTPKQDTTTYLVRDFALGQLLAPRSELLAPPPTPTPAPTPAPDADAQE